LSRPVGRIAPAGTGGTLPISARNYAAFGPALSRGPRPRVGRGVRAIRARRPPRASSPDRRVLVGDDARSNDLQPSHTQPCPRSTGYPAVVGPPTAALCPSAGSGNRVTQRSCGSRNPSVARGRSPARRCERWANRSSTARAYCVHVAGTPAERIMIVGQGRSIIQRLPTKGTSPAPRPPHPCRMP
jgi:hypothetical protein